MAVDAFWKQRQHDGRMKPPPQTQTQIAVDAFGSSANLKHQVGSSANLKHQVVSCSGRFRNANLKHQVGSSANLKHQVISCSGRFWKQRQP